MPLLGTCPTCGNATRADSSEKSNCREGAKKVQIRVVPKGPFPYAFLLHPEPSPSVEWERSETGAQRMNVMVAILDQRLLAIGEVPPFPTTPAVVPAHHNPPLNLFQQDLNPVTGVRSCWISVLRDSTLLPSLNLAWDQAALQCAFWLQCRDML